MMCTAMAPIRTWSFDLLDDGGKNGHSLAVPRRVQQLEEALFLPEACLLEHCEERHREILRGRVGSLVRSELAVEREEPENTLSLAALGFGIGTEQPGQESRSSQPVESPVCVPPPLSGLRRQPSFKPDSMLTDAEQCNVRGRRKACVLRLARKAALSVFTSGKISKCRRRHYQQQQLQQQLDTPHAL